MNELKGVAHTLIVAFNNSPGDNPILLVGDQKDGKISVISAFQGQEAIDLYRKLVKKDESISE